MTTQNWNDFNDAEQQQGFDLIPKGTIVPVRMTIKPGGHDDPSQNWTGGYATQPTQDMRIPDSVIRVMRHKGKIGQDIDHPAVFPVALPEFVIEAFTDEGDVVFEPFCGSGSTMLAAQRSGRICRSVEIAPEYVDVAIRRFRQHHPEVAVTLLATGQTFDEIVAEREAEVTA